MANYAGNKDKLVDSEYLYKQFSNFDKRRADKLDKALFITTKEHYELASKQDGSEGKIIVANGLISSPDTEVELATVQANILDTDLHSYQVAEYVVLVPEKKEEIYLKAATLNHETEDLDLDTLD